MVEINLSGKTKIVTLIGNPVEHSMSPKMHTAAFKEINKDIIYIATKVENSQIKEAIHGLKALNFKGANVTVPHKVEAMKYVDEIEPIAQKIGAINTIINDNGSLKATNTDALGFIRSLKDTGIDIANTNAVMIGAGGVARAISFSLLQENIKELLLTDLQDDVALSLQSNLQKYYSKEKITYFESNNEELKKAIDKANLVINCTPVGMSPNIDRSPVPEEFLRAELTIFDAIYNPLDTLLIKQAKNIGAKTISGMKMFLYQGVEAFERWTNEKAPISVMEKMILEGLSNK